MLRRIELQESISGTRNWLVSPKEHDRKVLAKLRPESRRPVVESDIYSKECN
jgi:hypothetical protein